MRKVLYAILLNVALMVTVAGCGGGDTFRITGEIEGIGTQNLNIVYYGDGAIRSFRTAVVDGKFMFDGSSRDWTTLYIFTSRHTLIGVAVVRNGESLQARFDVTDPSKISLKGNNPSELLGAWLSKNADRLTGNDPVATNNAVKEFVVTNKASIASTVALLNWYRADINPGGADSLFRIIDNKARPNYMAEGWVSLLEIQSDSTSRALPTGIRMLDVSDSLQTLDLDGKMLWAYLPVDERRNATTDSIIADRLKKIRKDSADVMFVEIDRYVDDTSTWKKAVRGDSLRWQRLWHPLNVAELPIAKDSIFLVTDPTGHVIYTGNDIWTAIRILNIY